MVTIVSGSSGDREDDSKCPSSLTLPAVECSQNYGCEDAPSGRSARFSAHANSVLCSCSRLRRACLRTPDPLPPSADGFFTALNATAATWSYKTILADGPGPKDYKDTLTIVQHSHRLSTL